MAHDGASLDGGDAEQESQHGPFSCESMGLEGLRETGEIAARCGNSQKTPSLASSNLLWHTNSLSHGRVVLLRFGAQVPNEHLLQV